MKFAFKNTISLLSVLATVSAHGYVPYISIGGTKYQANAIGDTSTDSVLRSVTSQDPMQPADNKDLSCGPGSKAAALSADAQAGDEIEVAWTGEAGGNWPHNTGPMLTYLSLCDGDCADVDPAEAEWFKIEETAMTSDGTWAQQAIMDGDTAKVTLPSDLAPGNYLFRHEIIALHNAVSEGGAEFYANCAQLTVSGSGSGSPSSDDLVVFPGAYKDSDAGIYVPDVYSMKKGDYEFPGPEVVDFASSGSGGGDDNGDDGDSSSSSSKPTSTTKTHSGHSTKTSSSSDAGETGDSGSGSGSGHIGGSCNLKPSSSSSSEKKRSSISRKRATGPKHYSRIMRDIVGSLHI